jgi:hypothetical protein
VLPGGAFAHRGPLQQARRHRRLGHARRHGVDAQALRCTGILVQRVAADARARFEEALEPVALREGLLLPPSAA